MFWKNFVASFLAFWLICSLISFGSYLNDRYTASNGADKAGVIPVLLVSVVGGPLVLGGSIALR